MLKIKADYDKKATPPFESRSNSFRSTDDVQIQSKRSSLKAKGDLKNQITYTRTELLIPLALRHPRLCGEMLTELDHYRNRST